MAITYIKKAEKTAFTGEDETRTKVSSILKTYAVARRFDCVMVWSLDRLARSVEHFVNTTNELNSLNIQIYFIIVRNFG